MEPTAALAETLDLLFDENELRTLFSTDLYFGDLARRMPPRGAGGLAAAMVRGLVEERRLGRAFFRTLAALRPREQVLLQRVEALVSARRVLVLCGDPCDPGREVQARHDARFAAALADQATAAGHRALVCVAVGSEARSLTLELALEDCDALGLVRSAALPPAAPERILRVLAERRAGGAGPLIVALATGEGPSLPLPEPPLACGEPATVQASVAAFLARLAALPLGAPGAGGGHAGPWPPLRTGRAPPTARPGPSPRAEARRRILHGEGEEIAQEVLTRPVELLAAGDGVRAVIDRSDVATLVLGAEARKALWLQELGSRAGLARALAWDAHFQEALTSGPGQPPPAGPCPPLRWGGAGAVLELTWRGRTWVPLFFRDIPPFGWNLPLGASGAGDDLGDPVGWGTRELLEELIVVAAEPAWGRPLEFRPLLVDAAQDPAAGRTRALAHARLALALRERCDRLPAVEAPGVPCAAQPVRAELCLRGAGDERVIPDLLTAPTPLELGLDVARVLRAALDDGDSLLDGEVLEREDGRQELVRMPVALLAVEALRRLFGPGAAATVAEGSPPSVRTAGFLPDEVHVFPWDVRRRRDLAVGARIADGQIDPRERARHRAWLDRFGPNFLDARGEPSSADPSPLFVGSSARLLTAWARLGA